MPELPEVQHAADTLGAQIIGRRIVRVTKLDWPKMLESSSPAIFCGLIEGRRVLASGRRDKWIIVTLDGGWSLALHLRMSGYLSVVATESIPDKHTHLVLLLDDGRQVFFHDTRKFGRVRLLDAAGLQALDAGHGREPLHDDFTPATLAELLHGRRRAIKPLLLDQALIAGIGNISADEALWRARIHPLRSADTLDRSEIEQLHAAIVAALTAGLRNGGSTLRDYRNAYGEKGTNQHEFRAYGRTGDPCERCGTPIARSVVAQRGTHHCPTCQPSDETK
ncbi:MAG TPA: bifunctional DNA-formamidopyrimidine glycosylase/DNA-(apurinic or apyrimidinic site) lyase [Roseiflexaceae bacterium]|nr:bifunctional DNA-formamidopyrimidine glycosylase/DNA-(apurinic or apyrimidinic site) lyase [Roseiflexaceae bacterium]